MPHAHIFYLRLSAVHLRPSALPRFIACVTLCCLPLATAAEVKATNAWVRATVPAQKSTGAFLTLTSTEEAKVVGATSPAAKVVELHESTHEKGVMQMRALEAIALPAGKAVELRPGGKHVMLLGLARPVAEGDAVPIVFTIEDARGKRTTLEVRAQARPLGAR